jgi:hypothetical protein
MTKLAEANRVAGRASGRHADCGRSTNTLTGGRSQTDGHRDQFLGKRDGGASGYLLAPVANEMPRTWEERCGAAMRANVVIGEAPPARSEHGSGVA